MQIVNVRNVNNNFFFKWPDGSKERYDIAIDYDAISVDGKHVLRIGYCMRETYGRPRRRVVVWIDDYPYAEFLEADDFDVSGELLSEIRFYDKDKDSKRMCRYKDDRLPERYMSFTVDSMKRRIQEDGVHDAWAVVTNVADHFTMASLAALRRYESL